MNDNYELEEYNNLDKKPNSLIITTVVNFVFGGIGVVYITLFTLLLFYGIFFSGDPLPDIMAGTLGVYCLTLPIFITTTLFIASGVGVMKLKPWGYYTQMATAILAILSIIGIPYGLPILINLLNPEIKKLFSDKKNLPEIFTYNKQ